MASSKKLVIEFNPEKPDKPSCEFLIPFISDNGELAFLGTKSCTIRHYGLVILTNRAVTEIDLFAKLIDTGRTDIVEATYLQLFSVFLDAMQKVKIGNIVEIKGMANREIKLNVLSRTPSGFTIK